MDKKVIIGIILTLALAVTGAVFNYTKADFCGCVESPALSK